MAVHKAILKRFNVPAIQSDPVSFIRVLRSVFDLSLKRASDVKTRIYEGEAQIEIETWIPAKHDIRILDYVGFIDYDVPCAFETTRASFLALIESLKNEGREEIADAVSAIAALYEKE